MTLLLFALLAAVDFERDIEPVLAARCLSCHGERTQMKGLRLDSRQAALRVLSPGQSDKSLLLRQVAERKMPPSGPQLTEVQ